MRSMLALVRPSTRKVLEICGEPTRRILTLIAMISPDELRRLSYVAMEEGVSYVRSRDWDGPKNVPYLSMLKSRLLRRWGPHRLAFSGVPRRLICFEPFGHETRCELCGGLAGVLAGVCPS